MNSHILRNLRSEMLSFNELEKSTLYNLNFSDFIVRLKAEDISKLDDEVIETITKKLIKHIYTRKSGNNFNDFKYFINYLDLDTLSFFYDYISDANTYIGHTLLTQEEIADYKQLQDKISNIEKQSHPIITQVIQNNKKKIQNTLTDTEVFNQRSQQLVHDLYELTRKNSKQYIQILEKNEIVDNTNYFPDNWIQARIKSKYGDVKYKIKIQGETKSLTRNNIIEFLELVLQVNPDILIGNIIYAEDDKFYIHVDFVNKYMKHNPITAQNFPEIPDVELSEDTIHSLIDIAFLHGYYKLIEKKNPFIPSKSLTSVEFSEQDIENIKKYI